MVNRECLEEALRRLRDLEAFLEASDYDASEIDEIFGNVITLADDVQALLEEIE